VSLEVEFEPVRMRLREPAGEPKGALVLNHGRASDENDLFGILDTIDPDRRLLGLTTRGPLGGLPPGGRHWYAVERVGYPEAETFATGYGALTGALDEVLAERLIGWERTVIGGFSQGTVMSYAAGLGSGRPAPAAIVALSGFIPTVEGWRADVEGRPGTRVFIHHGAADPVIEVGFARRAREQLRAGGIEPDYRETEAGHWLPPEILPELAAFVAAAVPTSV
jgi:phospholipase/carboxylesterase